VSFFRKAFALCTGFASYQEILDVPVAVSLRYLAVLLALLSIGLTTAYLPRAHTFAKKQARWFGESVPAFTIKDGRVTSDAPQPVRAQQRDFVFILDTTGRVTGAETNTPVGLLLTANNAVLWTPGQVQQHGIRSLLPDGVVNGDYMTRYLQGMLLIGAPLAALLLFIVGGLAMLAHAWFFSFTAGILERGQPNPLTPPQLLNIAIHAITPAALVCAVYAAFGLREVDYWLVYLIVYGIFLVGAANTCRRLLFGEQAQEDESL
jgi:hypothetical protein